MSCFSVGSYADDYETNWSYQKGTEGPENWGALSKKYETCSKGEEQSPVDIETKKVIQDKKLPKLQFMYKKSILDIENDKHWIEVDFNNKSKLLIDGVSYKFTQVHFHIPSEHMINGKKAAMEAHFVHEQENGKGLAAVAVLFRKGAENKFYDSILGYLPLKANTERQYKSIVINARDLLPKSTSEYYFYKGSLTTPPCTEPLKWFVLRDKVELSEAQIKKLSTLYSMNVRPIFPLMHREIKKNF